MRLAQQFLCKLNYVYVFINCKSKNYTDIMVHGSLKGLKLFLVSNNFPFLRMIGQSTSSKTNKERITEHGDVMLVVRI